MWSKPEVINALATINHCFSWFFLMIDLLSRWERISKSVEFAVLWWLKMLNTFKIIFWSFVLLLRIDVSVHWSYYSALFGVYFFTFLYFLDNTEEQMAKMFLPWCMLCVHSITNLYQCAWNMSGNCLQTWFYSDGSFSCTSWRFSLVCCFSFSH